MRISDWSSDVCSSDLEHMVVEPDAVIGLWNAPRRCFGQLLDQAAELVAPRPDPAAAESVAPGGSQAAARPEERRAGQECGSPGRSRWPPQPPKNKHPQPHPNPHSPTPPPPPTP